MKTIAVICGFWVIQVAVAFAHNGTTECNGQEQDIEAADGAPLNQLGSTTFRVALCSTINVESACEEQKFSAKTITKFRIGKGISIPAGTLVVGRIATKAPATDGRIALIFDSISTPAGKRNFGQGNLVCRNGKVQVDRDGKLLTMNCKTFPGAPPGSCVCNGIGAIAAPKDGKDLIYWSYGQLLGNPYRTFVVLENADLIPGDILEVNAKYFVKPRHR